MARFVKGDVVVVPFLFSNLGKRAMCDQIVYLRQTATLSYIMPLISSPRKSKK